MCLCDCAFVRLCVCVTGERFSPVQHHRHVLPVVSNLTITLHRRLANFDDKCSDGDAEGNDDDAEDDGYDDGDDHDTDLVVSILILNMLGNKSDRVDRFLKMRLLTKLTLSKTPKKSEFWRNSISRECNLVSINIFGVRFFIHLLLNRIPKSAVIPCNSTSFLLG